MAESRRSRVIMLDLARDRTQIKSQKDKRNNFDLAIQTSDKPESDQDRDESEGGKIKFYTTQSNLMNKISSPQSMLWPKKVGDYSYDKNSKVSTAWGSSR